MKLAIAFCIAASLTHLTSAFAADRACTPTEAIVDLYDNATSLDADYATKEIAQLNVMDEVNQKAAKPNVPLIQQMTKSDLARFQDARHELIKLKMEQLAFANYVRDMRAISRTAEVASTINLNDLDASKISATDAKLFEVNIILGLRAAQKDPDEGKKPDPSRGCLVSTSLFLLEHFSMSQMAKYPTNQNVMNLILDLRRLETLVQISTTKFEMNFKDATDMKWRDDNPIMQNTFDKWVEKQPNSVQLIAKSALPYIDQIDKSDLQYQIDFNAKYADTVKKEFNSK